MAPETRARVALEKRAAKLTQEQIAAEMGVSQPQVSGWLRRVCRPSDIARARGAASRKVRIPLRWWLTPEEGGPAIPAVMSAESEDSTPHPQGERKAAARSVSAGGREARA